MPALFHKIGLRFLYPDNWLLDESEAAENETITVYSPGGAFWTVRRHGPKVTPAALVDATLSAMRAEYPEMDAEPLEDTIGPIELLGCEMNFYCLDLTNTARVWALEHDARSLVVFCQADDREWAQVGAIFQAMTTSLVTNLSGSAV